MATIFDCDGTLVDSEILVNEVLVEQVAEHGLEMAVEEAVRLFRGVKMAKCVELLESRLERSLPDTFIPEFRERMGRAFRTRLRAVEGAFEIVQSARPPICVASSGPLDKVRLSLQLTGLEQFFGDRVFSSYEIQSWKPEPDLFLHAARCLGVPAEACNVVEDSLPGISAGLAAGMRVFAYQPPGVELEVPPGVVAVKHLLELAPFLR